MKTYQVDRQAIEQRATQKCAADGSFVKVSYWVARHEQLERILSSGIIPHGIRNIFGHNCGGILDKPAEELVQDIFEPYQT